MPIISNSVAPIQPIALTTPERRLLQQACDNIMASGRFVSVRAILTSQEVEIHSGKHIASSHGRGEFGAEVAAAACASRRICISDLRDSQEYRSWNAGHSVSGVEAVSAIPFFADGDCAGALLFLVADAETLTERTIKFMERSAREVSRLLADAAQPQPEPAVAK